MDETGLCKPDQWAPPAEQKENKRETKLNQNNESTPRDTVTYSSCQSKAHERTLEVKTLDDSQTLTDSLE